MTLTVIQTTGWFMIGFSLGGLLTAFYTSIKLAQHGIVAREGV